MALHDRDTATQDNRNDMLPPKLLIAPGKLMISVGGWTIQLDKSVADAVAAQYRMQVSQAPAPVGVVQ